MNENSMTIAEVGKGKMAIVAKCSKQEKGQ
jgi:hypothetical protein